MDKGIYIYDIETLKNCFTYCAVNRDTKEQVSFVVWNDMNELPELMEHLSSIRGQVGFNNLNFDYPCLHFIINSQNRFIDLPASEIANLIYQEAQRVISEEYSAVRENLVKIPQLDLFKIWHYDNKARMTGLKKLEIAMGYDNVQDMPYGHDMEITDVFQVADILEYNMNDVLATAEFYERTIPKLELRRGVRRKYGLECMNYSDSKIGEELMLKLYCQHTGKPEHQIKKMRTRRKILHFEECIPSYVSFSTPDFNGLLEYLKTIHVSELKSSFAYTIEFGGFEFDLGTGGIHGCIKPGVYESTDDIIIVDSDVASLYPSLAIANNLYPEHLGEEFANIYENGIVKPRLEAKRTGDKVMADGFKLSANSIYGKSNSEYSWLCDPLYTLKTTLAGQLSLCMLSEMLMTRIPELTMLQINTDGLTVVIPRKCYDIHQQICKEWETITKLTLEHVNYKKMIIRDVNNYISVSEEGKIKYKGAFKPNEEMIKDGEYHKSFSQGIVPVAVAKYFLEDVPVENTVRECEDIYLFCKMGNTIGKWWAETFDINESGEEINIIRRQKNNRYYLSNSGSRFRKCTYKPNKETGEEELVKTEYEADKFVTIFNRKVIKPFDEYDVNYEYYIEECYKLIHRVDGTEERLLEEARLTRETAKREREEANFIKFCVDKVPTKRQYEMYAKEWLVEKWGERETK